MGPVVIFIVMIIVIRVVVPIYKIPSIIIVSFAISIIVQTIIAGDSINPIFAGIHPDVLF